MRTVPMIWGDLTKSDPAKPFCAVCGRTIKGGSFKVCIDMSGTKVVHPDDWERLPEKEKRQGEELVGPECKKKFPAEFLLKNTGETAGVNMSIRDLLTAHRAETATEELAAGWFAKLSAKAKKAYIKRYPNSRFAKKQRQKSSDKADRRYAFTQLRSHQRKEANLLLDISDVVQQKKRAQRGTPKYQALEERHQNLLAQRAKLNERKAKLETRHRSTLEAASVRDLIARHKTRQETAKATIEIQNHYLTTTRFMKAARGQAHALGLEWSSELTTDPMQKAGLANNRIEVTGSQNNIDAFKRWVEGHKPDDSKDKNGETASVRDLIRGHAELAKRAPRTTNKTVKDRERIRRRREQDAATKRKAKERVARLEEKKARIREQLDKVESDLRTINKTRATGKAMGAVKFY